jgi:hypothetical protein
MKIFILIQLLFGALSVQALEFNDLVLEKAKSSITDGELGIARDEATRVYNTLNPHYAEFCTATQYLPKVERANKGGTGGHATLFLNGACIDESARYPQLKVCDEGVDLTDPVNSGVGISLNLMFANVRFVAIPGRGNFYQGPVSWDQQITPEIVEQTREHYYDSPWFDGINLVEGETQDCECRKTSCNKEDLRKCLIDKNTGIDFAISYARSSFCTRLPMPKEAMNKVIKKLNESNSEAFEKSEDGKRGYTYNVVTDNCSHLIHNALASTGMFDPIKILESGTYNSARAVVSEGLNRTPILRHLTAKGEFGYMSLPLHTVVLVANRSINLAIEDAQTMFDNKDIHNTLDNSSYSWLPTGAGNVSSVINIRKDNTAFESGSVGVSELYNKEVFDEFTDPTDPDFKKLYSNYCENLKFHRAKLANGISSIEEKLRTGWTTWWAPSTTVFYDKLSSELEDKIKKIDSDLLYLSNSSNFNCE